MDKFSEDADLPEVPLVDDESEPPRSQLPLIMKRICQAITLVCAIAYFLQSAGILPPQPPQVGQVLFGGAMIGLLVILVCNFFLRSKRRNPAITARRLRLK